MAQKGTKLTKRKT